MELEAISLGQIIIAFIAAMGIPSAVMGFVVWKLERRISKREKQLEEREQAQEDLLILMVQSTGAAIALGEATARAVQRIPDAHCNGDMHAALNYASEMKHQQKDFLAKLVIRAIWDYGGGRNGRQVQQTAEKTPPPLGVLQKAGSLGRCYCDRSSNGFLRPCGL